MKPEPGVEELISHAKFIYGCAHTRLEPVRCGSNINQNDIWIALDYLEEAGKKLAQLERLLKEKQHAAS